MRQQIVITYYHHSGFSVNNGDVLLIFDYWLGERHELPEEDRITREFLQKFRKTFVFISHAHPDHLDPEVFTWKDWADVSYIVSYDMPVGTRGRRMSPGDRLTLLADLEVRAYGSTDLGVSYAVDFAGFHLFHAGDLNFWHWRDESTIAEIEEADRQFRDCVTPIEQEKLDVCFFPVDPRQGSLYDAGANYFIMTVRPRLLIPMHFWGRGDLMEEFARRSRTAETEIAALTRPGEQMLLTLAEDGVLEVTTSIPKDMLERLQSAPAEGELPGEENPFTETDLPVNLDE